MLPRDRFLAALRAVLTKSNFFCTCRQSVCLASACRGFRLDHRVHLVGCLRCCLGHFQLHCRRQRRLQGAAVELGPREEAPRVEPLEVVAPENAQKARYASACRTTVPGAHSACTQGLEYAGVAVGRSGGAPK